MPVNGTRSRGPTVTRSMPRLLLADRGFERSARICPGCVGDFGKKSSSPKTWKLRQQVTFPLPLANCWILASRVPIEDETVLRCGRRLL
jgi:hypothetical protein